jgi:(p)ppGpp synthase/HD superfamily hydrolase
VKSLIDTFKEIATNVHLEQKRSDGKPYITHCEAVASKVEEELEERYYNWRVNEDVAIATAWAHDVLEDQPLAFAKFFCPDFPVTSQELEVCENVFVLSRPKKVMDIIAYLERVKANPVCRLVKLMDLEHNLSDLKAGNLMDKYLLCKNYLEG